MYKPDLHIFSPISLDEMNGVSLMKRTDTKFITSENMLQKILADIAEEYSVLEIENTRLMRYESLYYDTSNLDFYNMHHNGIARRIKVRTRKYVESGISFLEIKQKNAQGQTVKNRISIPEYDQLESGVLGKYTTQVLKRAIDLEATIVNSFNRFTLVNKHRQERVTIDTSIQFEGNVLADGLVIIELKQEKLDRTSPIFISLKKHRIYPSGFSKYCIGLAANKPDLKRNNFKPKFRTLKKILTA